MHPSIVQCMEIVYLWFLTFHVCYIDYFIHFVQLDKSEQSVFSCTSVSHALFKSECLCNRMSESL